MTRYVSVPILVCASLVADRAAADRGEPVVVERVVAVVNEDAIFLSQIRRRSVPFLEQIMSLPTQVQRMAQIEQLYRQLLDQLIDEQLVQQAAHDMQVRVTSADVDRAIQNVRRQSGLDDAEFWQAVRGQGFTEAQYRSDVRRQLLRLKVLNSHSQGHMNVTEAEVRSRYDQMLREANHGTCFDVSMRLYRTTQDDSATDVATARREAEEGRRRLTPDSFGGIDLGRICQGELDPRLDRALGGLRVGQISQPVRGPNGYVILYVRGRARSSNVRPYTEMRAVISRQLIEERMQRQEHVLLARLRREAVIERRLHHERDP